MSLVLWFRSPIHKSVTSRPQNTPFSFSNTSNLAERRPYGQDTSDHAQKHDRRSGSPIHTLDMGLPQNRDSIFLIASVETHGAYQVFADSSSLSRDFTALHNFQQFDSKDHSDLLVDWKPIDEFYRYFREKDAVVHIFQGKPNCKYDNLDHNLDRPYF